MCIILAIPLLKALPKNTIKVIFLALLILFFIGAFKIYLQNPSNSNFADAMLITGNIVYSKIYHYLLRMSIWFTKDLGKCPTPQNEDVGKQIAVMIRKYVLFWIDLASNSYAKCVKKWI